MSPFDIQFIPLITIQSTDSILIKVSTMFAHNITIFYLPDISLSSKLDFSLLFAINRQRFVKPVSDH